MRKYFTIAEEDLKDILHIEKQTRSNHFICSCPFCGKDKHFYINRKTQMFDCKKCGTNGSIIKLLKHLDKTYLLGERSVERTDIIKSIRQAIEDEIREEATLETLPTKTLPVGFKVCIGNAYLKKRGLSNKDINYYHIGTTRLVSKYKNYIIIPIYDNGEIRGFIGRYGDKHVPEDKLRYMNSLDTDFGSLLFGYDEIVRGKTETVIIVEGVFDKIAVDRFLDLRSEDEVKCVCTFGKKISYTQIKKLLLKQISNVILSYDYDALKEIRAYGLELDKYFHTDVAVCAFKKDIDLCTQEEALMVFDQLRPVQDFNVSVLAKLKR